MIPGIVLAGGKSSRMGRPKAELEIGKQGGVTNVTIRGDDLIDYDLDCLYQALAKASVPAPAGGKAGLVSCGFAFTRSP